MFSKSLSAAVKLRLADHLHQKPALVEELAELCGVQADRLARTVRVLAADGIFQFTTTGKLHLNAVISSQRLPVATHHFAHAKKAPVPWYNPFHHRCLLPAPPGSRSTRCTLHDGHALRLRVFAGQI